MVTKQSPNITLFVNLVSPDNSLDQLYLGNYANLHILDPLRRIPGMGKADVLGAAQYAMRIWLDPEKLASLGLTATDVVSAIESQNAQVAAGKLGQPPLPSGQAFQYQINTLGRLSQVKQFEDIIVKAEPGKRLVRISDIGRVELGAESYDTVAKLNGGPTASIAVYQLPDANALDLAKAVEAEMEDLKKDFPEGLDYEIVYNTTTFVEKSMEEVAETLFEAFLLVFAVVFLFLQNWRATVIPAIAIPVSLIGTFALMLLLGFSINTLSMLGLVLAIGLVVDDAIVVVENVERQLEMGLPPMQAAKIAMKEVTSPIVATTAVLGAVFVPVAFMPGITGQLYNQFALTIACSVFLSAINSLTLSPALCAIILKPKHGEGNFFFRAFNTGFDKMSHGYSKLVRWLGKLWYLVLLAFAGLLVATYFLLTSLPTAFVPAEDQGYFVVAVNGPEGASLERTEATADKVSKMLRDHPGVADVVTIIGFSLIDGSVASNAASLFPVLKPWDDRTTPELSLEGILGSMQAEFQKVEEAIVFAFNPPPIPGLGTTGGFTFELQDLNGKGTEALAEITKDFMQEAQKQPELSGLFTTFQAEVPQIFLDVDRTKAISLGIPLDDLFNTLQIYLGSFYINDFDLFGRVFKVIAQAEGGSRAQLSDLERVYVRTVDGDMVPISTLANTRAITGPQLVTHYNIYPAVSINGDAAPGYSSGQAIAAMERVADQILSPAGYGYEWTGVTYQQLKAGNLAPLVFGLAFVAVFLFLAAQYESWAMPFMVMLAVPMAILGASGALSIRGLANDVYAQIGLVMLIGLAAKNAILIVEFAKRRREEGAEIIEAAMDAARLRLRPILMTAFAFILGVVPLVIATGAGANSRHSLGTTVFGGMIVSTVLSLLVVPVLYIVIEKFREGSPRKKPTLSDDTAG